MISEKNDSQYEMKVTDGEGNVLGVDCKSRRQPLVLGAQRWQALPFPEVLPRG